VIGWLLRKLTGRGITLGWSEDTEQRLERLRAEIGAPDKAALFLIAVATLDLLTQEQSFGADVVIRRVDGTEASFTVQCYKPPSPNGDVNADDV
jgi:ABC-type hemin transport system substrate-binding protein